MVRGKSSPSGTRACNRIIPLGVGDSGVIVREEPGARSWKGSPVSPAGRWYFPPSSHRRSVSREGKGQLEMGPRED